MIDSIGRKPGLIIPIIGITLKVLITILQITLNLPLELLILGYIIDSLLGSFGAFSSASYSFLSDTVPQEERGKRLAIAEVVSLVGMAAMTFVIGILIEKTGFLCPFVVVLAGLGVNMIYTVFFVPETMETDTKKGSMTPMYVIHSFKVR